MAKSRELIVFYDRPVPYNKIIGPRVLVDDGRLECNPCPRGRPEHFDLHHGVAEISHKSFYTVPFTHSVGTLLCVYSCKLFANQWSSDVVEMYNYRVQQHIGLCTAHASLAALIESRKCTLSGIQSSFFSPFLTTICLARRFFTDSTLKLATLHSLLPIKLEHPTFNCSFRMLWTD